AHPARAREVPRDDRVADESAYEGLVLGCEAELARQVRHEGLVGRRRAARARARDEARMLRHDGRPALATASHFLEQSDAACDVVNDHVLQSGAEEAGERLRELLGGLDSIGDETRDARVARADERLRADADALEARVHLLERAVARALPGELRL